MLTGAGCRSEHYLIIHRSCACVAGSSHSNKGCFVGLFGGITKDCSSVIETDFDKYTSLLFPLAPAAHTTACGYVQEVRRNLWRYGVLSGTNPHSSSGWNYKPKKRDTTFIRGPEGRELWIVFIY